MEFLRKEALLVTNGDSNNITGNVLARGILASRFERRRVRLNNSQPTGMHMSFYLARGLTKFIPEKLGETDVNGNNTIEYLTEQELMEHSEADQLAYMMVPFMVDEQPFNPEDIIHATHIQKYFLGKAVQVDIRLTRG